MSQKSPVVKVVLPVIIILLAVGGALVLIKSRQAPQKEPPENPGILVNVLEVEKQDHRVLIHGTGTVQPRQVSSITPQVSGRVIRISPKLVEGGFFQRGEELFAIEAIDYQLAVEQAEATLSRAELELETARAQARIAQQEWQRLKRTDEEPNPLVLYEPQLKTAEANLASAQARLEQARLDLQRTRLAAPFDCYVRSEDVDTGQYVKAGNSVAVVAGTDQVEIIVPLQLEELKWLQIPSPVADMEGSAAEVRLAVGTKEFTWPGRIVRSLGEVDPQGRMRRVVIAVEDPYSLQETNSGHRPDLVVGTFVHVTLLGETLEDVAVFPRSALRQDNTVWLVDEQSQLRIATVKVLHRERELVLANGGLDGGEQIVVTNISGAADGMKLRPAPVEAQQ